MSGLSFLPTGPLFCGRSLDFGCAREMPVVLHHREVPDRLEIHRGDLHPFFRSSSAALSRPPAAEPNANM
jgi:hypothetical protein